MYLSVIYLCTHVCNHTLGIFFITMIASSSGARRSWRSRFLGYLCVREGTGGAVFSNFRNGGALFCEKSIYQASCASGFPEFELLSAHMLKFLITYALTPVVLELITPRLGHQFINVEFLVPSCSWSNP